MSIVEVFLRGSLMYLIMLALLRVVRRDVGSLAIADLLVIVLIADAAQNAMGSRYESITEGIVLVVTILFWSYLIDFLAFKFPRFRWLAAPAPSAWSMSPWCR